MSETRGGKREGAGRPTKVDEVKVNTIFLTALKQLHSKESDEEAKVCLVKDLYKTPRGQIFIAEHLLGKPKETIENINHNFNQDLTDEEAKKINDILEDKY